MYFLANIDLKSLIDTPLGRFLFNVPEGTTLSDNLEFGFKEPLPGWLILLIALPAVALVAFVYFKESGNAGRWSKVFMAFMRLFVLALLLIVFMQPTVLSIQSREYPPTIIVMIDTSGSMDFNDPGLDPAAAENLAKAISKTVENIHEMSRFAIVKEFLKDPNLRLLEKLEKEGLVKIVTFDKDINYDIFKPDAEDPDRREAQFREKLDSLEPTGTETNVPKALLEVLEKSSADYKVAAIILISDGRTSSAISDASKAESDYINRLLEEVLKDPVKSKIKIYTFIVGDTRPRKDLIMRAIEGPAKVSKDGLIRIDVYVTQVQYETGEFDIVLLEQNADPGAHDAKYEEVERRTVKMTRPPGDRTTKEIKETFEIKPKDKGRWRFIARIGNAPTDEADKDNNETDPALNVEVTERRLKVLYVEGGPRWEYRFLKNVLTRNKDEFIAWCLLLSADSGFPQEHTLGEYVNEQGRRIPIEPLDSFPKPEDLNQFDVLIWGDVDPNMNTYGVTRETLEQIASWVTTGRAGDAVEGAPTAAKGGGLICILGEQFFPRSYKEFSSSITGKQSIADILPFRIVESSVSPDELYGEQKEDFKYKLTTAGLDSELFRFFRDADKNRKFWEERVIDGQSRGLPGSYWYWPIEQPLPTAKIYLEHPDKKNKEGQHYPLALEHHVGNGVVFVMAFDDTWRWRYEVGDKLFAKYWIRLVKTIAEGGVLQRQFSISTDRPEYIKGRDPVNVRVTVLDKDLKPVSNEEVYVYYQGKDREGKDMPEVKVALQAEKKLGEGDRSVNTGDFTGKIDPLQLKDGSYVIWLDDELVSSTGEHKERVSAYFSVKAVNAEKTDPTAWEEGLKLIAENAGTQKVRPLTDLAVVIGEIKSPKVSVDIDKKPIYVWAAWITLFAALLFLCIEWIVRKLKRLI